MTKPTQDDKLANRQRMQALGLRVERIREDQRKGYIRGNLAVHMAIKKKKEGTA